MLFQYLVEVLVPLENYGTKTDFKNQRDPFYAAEAEAYQSDVAKSQALVQAENKRQQDRYIFQFQERSQEFRQKGDMAENR